MESNANGMHKMHDKNNTSERVTLTPTSQQELSRSVFVQEPLDPEVVVKREIIEEDFGSGAVQTENMQGQCSDKGSTEENSLDGVQLWRVKKEPSESEDRKSTYHQDFNVCKETDQTDNNHVYKWTVASSKTISKKVGGGTVNKRIKVVGGTVTEPMEVDGGTVTKQMKVEDRVTEPSRVVGISLLKPTKVSGAGLESIILHKQPFPGSVPITISSATEPKNVTITSIGYTSLQNARSLPIPNRAFSETMKIEPSQNSDQDPEHSNREDGGTSNIEDMKQVSPGVENENSYKDGASEHSKRAVETNRTETEAAGKVSTKVQQKASNKEAFGPGKVLISLLNRSKQTNSVVKSEQLVSEDTVQKALLALKYKNLRGSLKNNWSFLYNCTLLWSNENCIEYLRFYHGEATAIQLSVKIRSDFTPLIQVHGKHVSPEHDFWSGLPEKYTTPADIVKLLNKLYYFKVCIGNPDKEYQSLIKSHVESCQPPQAYVEENFGAVKDGVSYTSSIRSIACELLTKNKRCKKCLLHRNTLIKAKNQVAKDKQNAPSDLMTNQKPHSQMNSEELTVKLQQALEQAKSLTEENKQLRQKLTRKEDALKKSGRTIGTTFMTGGELNMGTYLSTSESGHVPELNDFTITTESNDQDTPAHREEGSKDGTTIMVVPTEMSTNKDFQAEIGSQGGGPSEGLVLKAMNGETKMNSLLRENDADFTNNHVPEKTGIRNNKSGLLIKGDPGTSVNNLNEETMQRNDHLNMVEIQGKDHFNIVHMQIREQFDKVVKDHLSFVQDCDVNKRNELDTKFNTPLMLPQNLDSSLASQIGVRHKDEKPIQSNDTAEMCDDSHPVAASKNPHPDLEYSLPSDMQDCKECGKIFPRLQDLKKHVRTHQAIKTFKCRRCKKIFPSLSILVAHRKVHAAEKRVKRERKCDKCGKAFTNAIQLQSHTIREHWEDNQFKCNKCDKVFSQYSALIMHKRTHIVEKPFKCCICNRDYTTTYALTAHMKTHSGERPYKCTQCSKAYFSSTSLKSHMRIHTGERPNKCKLCGKTYRCSSSLLAHMMVHSGEKPFKCDYCDISFRLSGALTVHQRIHTGEKPFKCDHCPKAFSRKSSLKTHTLIHTGEKPYKCMLCNMAFTNSCNLTRHKRIHSGERPYQCELCGKSFTTSTKLKDHLMVHNGVKPKQYGKSCEICEKVFSHSSYYKIHMRLHTGERPYQCVVCDKSFNQSGSLKTHMRMHTGEKPFQCNLCEKAFVHKCSLKEHAVTHSGGKPHTCEQCGLAFGNKSNLGRHRRTHTGEKPFQCEQCGKAFAQSVHLKAHIKTHKSRSNNAGSQTKTD